jgi:hypothetical protein
MAKKGEVIFEPMTAEQCLTLKSVNNNCQWAYVITIGFFVPGSVLTPMGQDS